MRVSIVAVRPPGVLHGVVVCTFFGEDGRMAVVLQVEPVCARATAAALLRCAEEAEREPQELTTNTTEKLRQQDM